jgi:hypothetical protein
MATGRKTEEAESEGRSAMASKSSRMKNANAVLMRISDSNQRTMKECSKMASLLNQMDRKLFSRRLLVPLPFPVAPPKFRPRTARDRALAKFIEECRRINRTLLKQCRETASNLAELIDLN